MYKPISSKCKKLTEKEYLDRPSPPYHANNCPYEILLGNDKKKYISLSNKNGRFTWKPTNLYKSLPDPRKYKDEVYNSGDGYFYSDKDINGNYYWRILNIKQKKNAVDYFKQFPNHNTPKYDTSFIYKNIKNLEKDLNKIKIKLFYFKWTHPNFYSMDGGYVSRQWGEIMAEYIAENYNEKQYPNGYIFFCEEQIYLASITCELFIYHNINPKIKSEFNDIIKSNFPNRTSGLNQSSDAILISIKELKKIKSTKYHIPMHVSIKFKDNKIFLPEQGYKLSNKIWKVIGKRIINDLRDGSSGNGYLDIWYEVYIDKIEDFANSFKNIKIPDIPDIKKITINYEYEEDYVEGSESWTWIY